MFYLNLVTVNSFETIILLYNRAFLNHNTLKKASEPDSVSD